MFVCILNCSSVNQIFVDFAFKVLNLGYNTTIRLQLWDIARQERFSSTTRVRWCLVLLFDISYCFIINVDIHVDMFFL